MEFSFDKVADALYLRFSYEEVESTEEIDKGLIIDYGKENHIVGIEILNFSDRKLDLNDLIQLHAEEIIPMVVQCQ
ncbi:MAG: DUF2283 domain-containing protein [Promethearchaeota archaeon]|nr:MAG: DUF2283 domain-containing protein [Candidatus Lokiarchaeota archaeon]